MLACKTDVKPNLMIVMMMIHNISVILPTVNCFHNEKTFEQISANVTPENETF